MQQCIFMRYYYTFPCAIPLLWAGYSRVTRPSATVLLLIRSEKFIRRILVRLACVRHAASVRPEPGSNSRSFYPSSLFKGCFTHSPLTSFSQNSSAFSEFFVCKKLSKLLSYPLGYFQELTLFIFQCTIRCRFQQLCYYIISPPLCQYLFENFFQVLFIPCVRFLFLYRPSLTAILIYHISAAFVNTFFHLCLSFFSPTIYCV